MFGNNLLQRLVDTIYVLKILASPYMHELGHHGFNISFYIEITGHKRDEENKLSCSK